MVALVFPSRRMGAGQCRWGGWCAAGSQIHCSLPFFSYTDNSHSSLAVNPVNQELIGIVFVTWAEGAHHGRNHCKLIKCCKILNLGRFSAFAGQLMPMSINELLYLLVVKLYSNQHCHCDHAHLLSVASTILRAVPFSPTKCAR